MALCFFLAAIVRVRVLVLVEVAAFLAAGVFLAEAGFDAVLFDAVLFDVVFFDAVLFDAVL
jgi:hypothetical protein